MATGSNPVNFGHLSIPDADILNACIHCGMCLPVCPTYALTGRERSSPRGRIRLIKKVSEGELSMSKVFIDEMDFCLDCQACQTVCPAGIQYGQLVESSRAQIFTAGLDTRTLTKKFVFRFVFASAKRIKIFSRLLRFYQTTLAPLVKGLLPKRLADLQALSPQVSRRFSDELIPVESPGLKPVKHRVGLLSGCLMNVMFAEINQDTVEVLQENHCDVVTPRLQGCCGSLPAHNGDQQVARKYAKTLIEQFSHLDLDAIVVNSAGCSAFMKDYPALFSGDPDLSEKAARFGALVKDVNEFLIGLRPKRPANAMTGRATYHEACHLVHSQGISAAPKQLLQLIPDLEWVELPESTWCCGSAGIYNIVRHDESLQILARKMDNIAATEARIVVTANPGCLAQIAFGARQRGLDLEVLHPVTLLKRAYAGSALQL